MVTLHATNHAVNNTTNSIINTKTDTFVRSKRIWLTFYITPHLSTFEQACQFLWHLIQTTLSFPVSYSLLQQCIKHSSAHFFFQVRQPRCVFNNHKSIIIKVV